MKVFGKGRLTRDPETRYSQDGKAMVSFSVAVNRKFKREGQPDADFFDCKAFGKVAEFIGKYFKKASEILIMGADLQNEQWQDQQGTKKQKTVLIVNEVDFVGEKRREGQTAQPATGQEPTVYDFNESGEDLPF